MIKVNYVVTCDCCGENLKEATYDLTANCISLQPDYPPHTYYSMGTSILCYKCHKFALCALNERGSKLRSEGK